MDQLKCTAEIERCKFAPAEMRRGQHGEEGANPLARSQTNVAHRAGERSFLRRRSPRPRRAADASARSILETELLSRRTLAMVIASPYPPEKLPVARLKRKWGCDNPCHRRQSIFPYWGPTRPSAQPRRCRG